MKSTRKRLRRNKPSSSSQPSSESDPEFVEIVQPDNSGVVGTSAKASHEHAVEIPTAKQHIVSEKTKCWLFFPYQKKVCIFLIAIVSTQKRIVWSANCCLCFRGEKSTCRLCDKSFTCVDGHMKLTTSTLKAHLLKAHSTNAEVRTAYLLDEAEKLLGGTPRQGILKYAKQQTKYEGQLDFYPRDTHPDVRLNRVLTHWLSVYVLQWVHSSQTFQESGIRTPIPSFLGKNVREVENVRNFRRCVCAHWLFFCQDIFINMYYELLYPQLQLPKK